MDFSALEQAIQKLLQAKRHLDGHPTDQSLIDDFEEKLFQFKMNYGQYLNDILFDIYDEYCEDDPCPDVMDFFRAREVPVHPDDVLNGHALLEIKTQPLRFEMSDPEHRLSEVIWKAA
ncbi:hypothetical protein [Marinoscillum sp.]|uniref:hypothetical protein n=1 Tax=Marinoscillum sp. TaxID=2024838 RepID=UPI003BAD727B